MANNVMHTWQKKVYIAMHTGWPLEYIGQLPARAFNLIVRELDYREEIKEYNQTYRAAMVVAAVVAASGANRAKYEPDNFAGKPPLKPKEVTLMVPKKPITVKLGDGNTYTLSVLNANHMESIEEEYDDTFANLVINLRVRVLKQIAWVLLKENHPKLTRDEVGALITADVIPALSNAITKMV